MRLFFAAAVPRDVRSALATRVSSLPSIGGVRWSSEESLHITLRFLGDVPDGRLPAVLSAASGAPFAPGFRLRIERGGVFPNLRAPHIFWAAVTGDVDRLHDVARDIDGRLVAEGFPREEKRYTPHLTLGRTPVDVRLDAGASEKFLTGLNDFRSAPFDVKEIHLLQSHLSPAGSRYETLRTFSLG